MYPSSSLFAALILISRTATAEALLSTQCYVRSNNVTTPDARSPCGVLHGSGFLSCCDTGDKCLTHGLCSTQDKTESPAAYYVGGCTDPSYLDPSCNLACGGMNGSSIIYNSSNRWQCCGGANDEVGCFNPTNESFVGPAPADLQAKYTMLSNSSAMNTASASSISASGSSDLSRAAKAGIAVGCIMLSFLILGSTWLLFVCRRRWHQRTLMESENTKKQRDQRSQRAIDGNFLCATSPGHRSSIWGLSDSILTMSSRISDKGAERFPQNHAERSYSTLEPDRRRRPEPQPVGGKLSNTAERRSSAPVDRKSSEPVKMRYLEPVKNKPSLVRRCSDVEKAERVFTEPVGERSSDSVEKRPSFKRRYLDLETVERHSSAPVERKPSMKCKVSDLDRVRRQPSERGERRPSTRKSSGLEIVRHSSEPVKRGNPINRRHCNLETVGRPTPGPVEGRNSFEMSFTDLEALERGPPEIEQHKRKLSELEGDTIVRSELEGTQVPFVELSGSPLKYEMPRSEKRRFSWTAWDADLADSE